VLAPWLQTPTSYSTVFLFFELASHFFHHNKLSQKRKAGFSVLAHILDALCLILEGGSLTYFTVISEERLGAEPLELFRYGCLLRRFGVGT
jgi:hypothetical protein